MSHNGIENGLGRRAGYDAVRSEQGMIEVIVDRWSKARKTDFPWSVWRDGKRIYQGSAQASAEEAERVARSYCKLELKREPDRVTHL